MDSQYARQASSRAETSHQHHHSGHSTLSPAVARKPFIASPSPFSPTSVISSTPIASLHATGEISRDHGIKGGVPIRQRSKVIPQSSPRINHVNGFDATPSQVQGPSRNQLLRRDKLNDEVYPFKLIRQLDKISSQDPFGRSGNLVFGVIHVNMSKEHGLTVENVSTYTTVQAANERVLDLWQRKYGTEMFTRVSVGARTDAIPATLDHIKKRHNGPDHQPTASQNGLSGGVSVNNSHWVINKQCLCLNHMNGREERKIYAVKACVRDQGIHV
ncbi:hypothetical protein GGS21DRAFT_527816 [Xylaria nigripes]|nr:hypothetical protein GGS21DRAFT_527816 [Xylaria nigripes]